MIRVVVVDDHPVFRHGLRALLDALPELTVVGEGSDGDEALELVRRERPDVVVMDLNMPGLSGVDATRLVVKEAPDTGVLVLTMFEDD